MTLPQPDRSGGHQPLERPHGEAAEPGVGVDHEDQRRTGGRVIAHIPSYAGTGDDVEAPPTASPTAPLDVVDEATLLTRVARGDGEAFGAIAGRYAGAARRLARLVLHDAADADDAVQNGMLSAWRALDRYDPARPFRPWLMRIVLNAARDLRRRRNAHVTEDLGDGVQSGTVAPDVAAGRTIFHERLAAALAQLPERARVAVTLFDAEGYSHREIAELLGVPEGTVRSDVFHARRALRRHLAPYAEELR